METRPDQTPAPPTAAGAQESPPLVFISYANEDDAHTEQVRDLWNLLRSHGIDAKLDLPAAERRQDWPLWMLSQVRHADFVLIVASPEYRRRGEGDAAPGESRGVQWGPHSLAVLTAQTVLVPAASYIESSLCAETVNEYRSLFDTGQITL